MEVTKQCTRCKEIKNVVEFHNSKQTTDGFNRRCKKCVNELRTRSRKRNPNYKLKDKNSKLLREYGITLKEYNKMFINQNGVCAICNNPETLDNKSLAVDHCHNTGKVRGLLCTLCNTAIGKLNDNEILLQRATNYIKESKCQNNLKQYRKTFSLSMLIAI